MLVNVFKSYPRAECSATLRMLMAYRHVRPSNEGVRDSRVESRNSNKLDSPTRYGDSVVLYQSKENTAYEANEDTTV